MNFPSPWGNNDSVPNCAFCEVTQITFLSKMSWSYLSKLQRVKLSFLDLAWLCISISMYLSFAAFVLFGTNESSPIDLEDDFILLIGDRLLYTYWIFICIICVIFDLINRNRIFWNIQRLEAFDKEVNRQFTSNCTDFFCVLQNHHLKHRVIHWISDALLWHFDRFWTTPTTVVIMVGVWGNRINGGGNEWHVPI